MQAIPNDDAKKLLRAYGQALIFIGLSLCIVGQTVHGAHVLSIVLSALSMVASLSGIALFFKAKRAT